MIFDLPPEARVIDKVEAACTSDRWAHGASLRCQRRSKNFELLLDDTRSAARSGRKPGLEGSSRGLEGSPHGGIEL